LSCTNDRVDSPASECLAPIGNELTERIYELLYLDDVQDDRLELELRSLRNETGAEVYGELIFMLCHLRFDEGEAESHWGRIVSHRDDLRRQSEAAVDLRVAVVSYFVHVNKSYRNPKVLELHLFEQTRASAYRDELTGLYNYRYFNEHLDRELRRCERNGTPLSLLLVDVDDFKDYNDVHGHPAGNTLLVELARLFVGTVRETDSVSRYGGEEFAIVLPDTYKIDAKEIAERVRRVIEAANVPRPEGRGRDSTSISLGLATYPADARDPSGLVQCADKALYRAKADGKNRVVLYDQEIRSYRRRSIRLEGTMRTLDPSEQPIRTVELSEGGLSLVTHGNVAVGSIAEIQLAGAGGSGEISILAVVVAATGNPGQGNRIALKIVQVDRESRSRLTEVLEG